MAQTFWEKKWENMILNNFCVQVRKSPYEKSQSQHQSFGGKQYGWTDDSGGRWGSSLEALDRMAFILVVTIRCPVVTLKQGTHLKKKKIMNCGGFFLAWYKNQQRIKKQIIWKGIPIILVVTIRCPVVTLKQKTLKRHYGGFFKLVTKINSDIKKNKKIGKK